MSYDDKVRQVLADIVKNYGTSVSEEPGRCRALLVDYTRGQHKPEVNALITALEEEIPKELSTSGKKASGTFVNRLVYKLVTNRSMTEDAARWAVESWGIALGLTIEEWHEMQDQQEGQDKQDQKDEQKLEKAPKAPLAFIVATLFGLILSGYVSGRFLFQPKIQIQSYWWLLVPYGMSYALSQSVRTHHAPRTAQKLQGALCLIIAVTLFVLGIRTL